MKRLLTRSAVGLVSAGWLLPFAVAIVEFKAAADAAMPNAPVTSFPHAELAQQSLIVAAVWLGIVLVAWLAFGVLIYRNGRLTSAST